MTTTTAPKTARRRMTHTAYRTEAVTRFGPDPKTWRFRCPACDHTQSIADLPPERAEHVAQACFGCGQLAETMIGEDRAALIRVTLPDGTKTDSFPLADELDAPKPAQAPCGPVRDLAAVRDPERAILPAVPDCAPARPVWVPMPTIGFLGGAHAAYWTATQGWVNAADLNIGCSCHLSAPCTACELLLICGHCEVEVFVPDGDMAAHVAAIHPEYVESEA